MSDCCIFLEEELRLRFIAELLSLLFLLKCVSFISACLHLPIISACACSLELGWETPRSIKLFYTNKKQVTWRGFCTQKGPTGSWSVSAPPFPLYSSILRDQGQDKKGNKFWIQSLTINLARELRGTLSTV